MQRQTATRLFDVTFLILGCLLVIGTPLLFTSFTRSVFEVNKLLLLRLYLVITYGVWLFKTIYFQSNTTYIESTESESEADSTSSQSEESEYFTLFGFRWKKIGLEIPLLIWTLSNIISTITSKNIIVSIIGSYDRWEGIITTLNYALLIYAFGKLIQKRYQIQTILVCIFVAGGFSAIYGIFQSLGYDFMKWSVDPTARVFACINNPVHFCAYMGMLIPIGLGWLLQLSTSIETIKVNPKTKEGTAWWLLGVGLMIFLFLFQTMSTLTSLDLSGVNPFILFSIFASIILIPIGLAILLFFLIKKFKTEDPLKNIHVKWAILVGFTFYYSFLILKTIIDSDSLNTIYIYDMLKNTVPIIIIGLIPPIILFTLIILKSPFERKIELSILKLWFIFYTTILIYYAQFLSFSRATWIGFTGAMILFFLFSTNSISGKTIKEKYIDIIVTSLTTAAFILFEIFKFHQKNLFLGFLIIAILITYICFLFYKFIYSNEKYKKTRLPESLSTIALVGIIFLNYLTTLSGFPLLIQFFIHIILTASFLSTCLVINNDQKKILSRIIIFVIFAKLQFVTLSWINLLLYISLVVAYYLLCLKGNSSLKREKKVWLFSFLFIFGVILGLTSIPTQFSSLLKTKSIGLKVVNAASGKMSIYSSDALEGTARTSMWKSSFPWIKDHMLFGSGLDTIKYMYPKYRRSEYGILEGGHNFTPDRLHNEYLNRLSTSGLFGFFSYYILLILGWIIIMLNFIFTKQTHPYRYLAIGLLCSSLIYLGQVMFNFGVVATLVLFYIVLGLGLGIKLLPLPKEIKNED